MPVQVQGSGHTAEATEGGKVKMKFKKASLKVRLPLKASYIVAEACYSIYKNN